MKKIILFAAVVFAFSFANAQNIKYGAKVGLNLSKFDDNSDYYGDFTMKTGFQLGGLVEIKISDKFSIQPELLYSAQGVKYKYSYKVFDTNPLGSIVDVEKNQKFEYLNIPLMVKYYVADGFSLEAGPQIGFLMSSKLEKTKTGLGDSGIFRASTDFGFNLGTGYDIAENINLSFRYFIGLKNIIEYIEPFEVRNTNLAFAVGYKF